MSPDFLAQLAARRDAIESQWRTQLQLEQASTPLANPEVLQYLVPKVMGEILAEAARYRSSPETFDRARSELSLCNCTDNPYRIFYLAGQQAIMEAGVFVQSQQDQASRQIDDLMELLFVVRSAARAEIDAFCGACVHRGTQEHCPRK